MSQEILFADGAQVPEARAQALVESGYSIVDDAGIDGSSAIQPALAVIDAMADGVDAMPLRKQWRRRIPTGPVQILVGPAQTSRAGGDAVARPRQWRPRIPTRPGVGLVDRAQSALAGEAMRWGSMDYVLTPYTPEQFLTMAEDVSRLHQPIDGLVPSPHSRRQLLL